MSLPISRWIRLIEERSGHTLDGAFPGITGFRVIDETTKHEFGVIREIKMIIYTADKVHQIGIANPAEDKTPDEWIARRLIEHALADYPDKTVVHRQRPTAIDASQ